MPAKKRSKNKGDMTSPSKTQLNIGQLSKSALLVLTFSFALPKMFITLEGSPSSYSLFQRVVLNRREGASKIDEHTIHRPYFSDVTGLGCLSEDVMHNRSFLPETRLRIR